MDPVRWDERPALERAVLVCAFEGWNDAGDAGSTAARHLSRRWLARRVGAIDPEEFYDFSVTRPRVVLGDDQTRRVEWPEGELELARPPSAPRDVLFLHASEPHLRWRTYAGALVGIAKGVGAELVVTLGALLADVPHTRPVRVTGTAPDPAVASRLGLARSTYEGPTGIVGVLHDALRAAGITSVSLWAAVPHYLSSTPSPKAALVLVERMAELLGTQVDTVELDVAAAAYERQVDELLADDEEMAAYVQQLEQDEGDDELDWPPQPGSLAAEAERFLREHRPEA